MALSFFTGMNVALFAESRKTELKDFLQSLPSPSHSERRKYRRPSSANTRNGSTTLRQTTATRERNMLKRIRQWRKRRLACKRVRRIRRAKAMRCSPHLPPTVAADKLPTHALIAKHFHVVHGIPTEYRMKRFHSILRHSTRGVIVSDLSCFIVRSLTLKTVGEQLDVALATCGVSCLQFEELESHSTVHGLLESTPLLFIALRRHSTVLLVAPQESGKVVRKLMDMNQKHLQFDERNWHLVEVSGLTAEVRLDADWTVVHCLFQGLTLKWLVGPASRSSARNLVRSLVWSRQAILVGMKERWRLRLHYEFPSMVVAPNDPELTFPAIVRFTCGTPANVQGLDVCWNGQRIGSITDRACYSHRTGCDVAVVMLNPKLLRGLVRQCRPNAGSDVVNVEVKVQQRLATMLLCLKLPLCIF